MKSVSIVIPVFNSQETIEEVVSRTVETMQESQLSYEIILVDDGSSDNSWQKIHNLASKNKNIAGIKFFENSGQHTANLCGFRHSQNDVIVTIDDDLQNPPEEIPKLIEMIHEGKDLVFGEFDKKKHGFSRSIGSLIINKINKKIFSVQSSVSISNFRAVRRDVIDQVCNEKHFKPYIPGLILKYSKNIGGVPVNHDPRKYGKSNYTVRKLISLAFDLLFHHSTIPLRLATILGLMSSLIIFIFAAYTFFHAVITDAAVPGWASIAILVSLSSGLIILLIAIIGEYLVRILNQVSHQEIYKIQQKINK